VSSPRSILAVAVASVTILSACGASAPPAQELAIEIVDTLDVSDAVKDCMRDEIDGFTLTEEQAAGFSDLDDVAKKAAGGNETAIDIMADFEAALTACN
jgi:hypothetical protein